MRIAIVNDIKMTVELLRRILAQTEHSVAWVAYDGKEAVEKCVQDPPDIILMDLVMPVMNGVQASKTIMQKSPCAILIVTATVSGHASMVFEAMGAGALDVVRTPTLDPETQSELLIKIDRIGLLIGKKEKPTAKAAPPLLLIGASTGGPAALLELLSHFSQPIPFAAILAQHVDEQFSKGLARWLSEQAKVSVKIAEEGMEPKQGQILLAGKNDHLVLDKNGRLHYTEDPIDNPYRPSVDELFLSVASHYRQKGMAILLTGMGADGARGLKALRDLGWHTVAQDEKSSVVFGMPKAAIAQGAASEVLSLTEIPASILKYFRRK